MVYSCSHFGVTSHLLCYQMQPSCHLSRPTEKSTSLTKHIHELWELGTIDMSKVPVWSVPAWFSSHLHHVHSRMIQNLFQELSSENQMAFTEYQFHYLKANV